MSGSVEKCLRGWLGLACIFLAGASAGSFGYALCGMLTCGYGLDIESHEAMRADARGDQIRLESQDGLEREASRTDRTIDQQLDAFPVMLDHAFFQANQNDAVGQIFGADDRQNRAFVFEQIADSDLDLSVGIAQRHLLRQPLQEQQQPDQREHRSEHPTGNVEIFRAHAIPSRLKASLRYRQLYAFQNQFISRMLFSSLRDAPISTSVSEFGSISCLRPLVLRTNASRALGSAPADLSIAGWRDRGPMIDPGSFSMARCEQSLRDNPMDTAAFYGNIQRALAGNPWKRHNQQQPKLRKATAQRLATLRSAANGGLSKIPA